MQLESSLHYWISLLTFQRVDITNALFSSYRTFQNIYTPKNIYLWYVYICNTHIYITKGQKLLCIKCTTFLVICSFVYLFYSVRIIEELLYTSPRTETRNKRMGIQNMVPTVSTRVLQTKQPNIRIYLCWWLSPSGDSHFVLILSSRWQWHQWQASQGIWIKWDSPSQLRHLMPVKIFPSIFAHWWQCVSLLPNLTWTTSQKSWA